MDHEPFPAPRDDPCLTGPQIHNSGPHQSVSVANLTVTKKVRLEPREAAALRRLAKAKGQTESEVIRQGLHLMQERESRAAAIDEYIRFLGDEKEPPKIRFRLK